MNPKAERIRIRYLYRNSVLKGDVRVSHRAARRIVGPDCAYHLYGFLPPEGRNVRSRNRKSE
jgi:hypothetical protein